MALLFKKKNPFLPSPGETVSTWTPMLLVISQRYLYDDSMIGSILRDKADKT